MIEPKKADTQRDLAVLDVIGFFALCVIILMLVWFTKPISAVAAGLLGAIRAGVNNPG